MPQCSFTTRYKLYRITTRVSTATKMLVTGGCWWLYVGDNVWENGISNKFSILMKSFGCWCPTKIIKIINNIPKLSPINFVSNIRDFCLISDFGSGVFFVACWLNQLIHMHTKIRDYRVNWKIWLICRFRFRNFERISINFNIFTCKHKYNFGFKVALKMFSGFDGFFSLPRSP